VNGITYKDKHSFMDFNLILQSLSRPVLPALRKRELTVPGKHGVYDFGGNTFDTRTISVLLQYLGASIEDMRLNYRNVAAWLTSSAYLPLTFDDEPDKYYLAKIYDPAGLESLRRVGKATIQFECQPFALSVISSAEDIYLDDTVPLDSDVLLDSGDDYTYTLADVDSSDIVTVVYNGNTELGLGAEEGAQFDIIVTGTFSVFSISMNGKTLTYTENCVAQTITIDNVNATVKNGAVNKLSMTTRDVAEFLKLIPGNNIITISKTGGAVDFTFDFRSQFI